MRHRSRWWLVVAVGAATAAVEWTRTPLAPLAVVAAALALAAMARAAIDRRTADALAAALLVAAAAVAALTQRRLALIERDWPAQREARIEAYGARVGGELRGALRAATALAERGVAAARLERGAAFEALDRAVSRRGIETGVAVLEADGSPWAWAGRHRLLPEAAGDSLAARVSGYYVVLETRRHSMNRVVVASALIWADSAIVDRSRSLAELFRRETEVGLLVHPPGAAPGQNTDIFDYTEPTTAGPRLLFSVQPVPPEQAEARDRTLDRGARAVLGLTTAASLLLLMFSVGSARLLALLPIAWLAARAPVRRAISGGAVFAADAFGGSLPGGLTLAPAALLFAGAVLTAGAAWLWRSRRVAGVPSGRIVGAVLAATAPAVVAALGDGLATLPVHDLGFWLVVQLALVLAAAPLALASAALFAGSSEPRRWPALLAMIGAAVAGAATVAVADPGSSWPVGLTLLWIPLAIAAVLPAPRALTITAVAVVLGSLASSVLWRADLRARGLLAARDVAALGRVRDPAADSLLYEFGATVARARVPTSAADLHALWRHSKAAQARVPAQLSLWTGEGVLAAELPLDSLAIPSATVGAVARTSDSVPAPIELRTVPTAMGVHRILVVRAADDATVAVVGGPRSALVSPHRLGQLLDPGARRVAPYRLSLGPLADDGSAAGDGAWRRDRGAFRADPVIPLHGGARTIHATIEVPGAWRVAVRAILLALADVVALAALWGLARLLSGTAPLPLERGWIGHSFRLRLAVALALFFVLPTVAFAVWSFSHFGQEAARGRDLLITQTLRDAAQSAGALLRTPGVPAGEALRGLGDRVNADLALYRGGALVAASTPVLRDLGIIGPLLDPNVFRELALGDEVEVTSDGAIPSLAERIGYRVIEYGPGGGVGVLVTPQVGGIADTGRERTELALVLLLACAAGIIAAIGGAGVAARALSRPVADLRRAAVMLGRGQAPVLPADTPPTEFEPVFGAFTRMAADVRASQRALEEARKRTDTVLSTVATGVIALDPSGRILIANQRAVALIGATLEEGRDIRDLLPREWDALRGVLDRILADPHVPLEGVELSIGTRRITLQAAPMGTELSGVVLALGDVTDLSRAERILAWGEMARQVAHEIKNPLTPMRLGIQHLQRIYRDRRGDFETTLGETSQRILGEIDRLDTIARAFSRFAAPEREATPLERVDLAAVAGEVVQLYRLAGEGAEVTLVAEAGDLAVARRDEVKEVLVNLLENARAAGARHITVTVGGPSLVVADDGAGIPPELLPRIFEPRFSTTTSGSGLGLAIVRRLVESWGGAIDVTSEVGRGTTVRVRGGT